MLCITSFFVVVILLLCQRDAFGADPQPYTVTLKPTGNSALDSALHDASSLISLQEKAQVGGFALVERTRQDVDRFQAVMQSYGYYGAKIDVTIAGHPVSDPSLPDTIAGLPADPKAEIVASFAPGTQFHLGQVSVHGAVPTDARDKLGIAPGAPAVAADV